MRALENIKGMKCEADDDVQTGDSSGDTHREESKLEVAEMRTLRCSMGVTKKENM